jgi:hypothetical protein
VKRDSDIPYAFELLVCISKMGPDFMAIFFLYSGESLSSGLAAWASGEPGRTTALLAGEVFVRLFGAAVRRWLPGAGRPFWRLMLRSASESFCSGEGGSGGKLRTLSRKLDE